jgi:hypothetical protein
LTEEKPENCFDKPYKVLIEYEISPEYLLALDWANTNTNGNVQVKILRSQKVGNSWVVSPVGDDRAFFAFEKSDDALFFRVKYGGNISSGR